MWSPLRCCSLIHTCARLHPAHGTQGAWWPRQQRGLPACPSHGTHTPSSIRSSSANRWGSCPWLWRRAGKLAVQENSSGAEVSDGKPGPKRIGKATQALGSTVGPCWPCLSPEVTGAPEPPSDPGLAEHLWWRWHTGTYTAWLAAANAFAYPRPRWAGGCLSSVSPVKHRTFSLRHFGHSPSWSNHVTAVKLLLSSWVMHWFCCLSAGPSGLVSPCGTKDTGNWHVPSGFCCEWWALGIPCGLSAMDWRFGRPAGWPSRKELSLVSAAAVARIGGRNISSEGRLALLPNPLGSSRSLLPGGDCNTCFLQSGSEISMRYDTHWAQIKFIKSKSHVQKEGAKWWESVWCQKLS